MYKTRVFFITIWWCITIWFAEQKRSGEVNPLLDRLPIELHLPGFQYCGPGTKLEERLKRGDPGINPLDRYCKEHDIAYSQSKDLHKQNQADKELENRAWERVKSKDATVGEKAAAWLVTTGMKAKRKIEMGMFVKIFFFLLLMGLLNMY